MLAQIFKFGTHRCKCKPNCKLTCSCKNIYSAFNSLNVRFDGPLYRGPVSSIKLLPLKSNVGHNKCKVAFICRVEGSIWSQMTSGTKVFPNRLLRSFKISMFCLRVRSWKNQDLVDEELELVCMIGTKFAII